MACVASSSCSKTSPSWSHMFLHQRTHWFLHVWKKKERKRKKERRGEKKLEQKLEMKKKQYGLWPSTLLAGRQWPSTRKQLKEKEEDKASYFHCNLSELRKREKMLYDKPKSYLSLRAAWDRVRGTSGRAAEPLWKCRQKWRQQPQRGLPGFQSTSVALTVSVFCEQWMFL